MPPTVPVRLIDIDINNPETKELGVVYGVERVIDVVPVLDTNVLVAGDVIPDATIEIPNAVLVPGGKCLLHSLVLLDKSDQGVALEVYILRRLRSMGTANNPISITDAHAEDIIAVIPIAADDYFDLVNSKIANHRDQKAAGMVLQAHTDSTSLYLSLVVRDGATYAANGIMIKLGVVY